MGGGLGEEKRRERMESAAADDNEEEEGELNVYGNPLRQKARHRRGVTTAHGPAGGHSFTVCFVLSWAGPAPRPPRTGHTRRGGAQGRPNALPGADLRGKLRTDFSPRCDEAGPTLPSFFVTVSTRVVTKRGFQSSLSKLLYVSGVFWYYPHHGLFCFLLNVVM